jgi:hypothetical protein
MIRDDYYLDDARKVRLDKVLLGFEIDPLNNSLTIEEKQVRANRERIENELMKNTDEYMLELIGDDVARNLEFFA